MSTICTPAGSTVERPATVEVGTAHRGAARLAGTEAWQLGLLASLVVVYLAGSSAPTPLYATHQRAWAVPVLPGDDHRRVRRVRARRPARHERTYPVQIGLGQENETTRTLRTSAAASARTAQPSSPRERLLDAAAELFYRDGVHTVGIDRLLEHAGVAKASLYNTFGSKDELVRAYLQRRHTLTTTRIQAAVDRANAPRDKLLAIFDAQATIMGQPGFNGCAFASATSEAHSPLVDDVTAEYRAWFRALFTGLATEAGAPDPATLGRQLHLLYDGAGLTARMDQDPDVAAPARAAAATLIDAATS